MHLASMRTAIIAAVTAACFSLTVSPPAQAQDQGQTGGAQQPQSIFREAFVLTPNAKTLADFDRIVEMCESGFNGGATTDLEYGRSLAAWAYNKRGELHAAEADGAAAALADFEKAVEFAPENWRYHHNRGVSLAGAGRMDEALADIDMVIQVQPQFAKAYFNRGEIRFALGQMNEAIDAYSRAIELGRTDAEAYANRGDAYTAMTRYASALRDYQQAIQLETNLGRAYRGAAWIMATSGEQGVRDPRRALQLAQQAASLQAEEHQTIDILALCQASIGDYRTASETQRRAITLAEGAQAPEELVNQYRERLAEYEKRATAGTTNNGRRA